jgi:hypothetical protein
MVMCGGDFSQHVSELLNRITAAPALTTHESRTITQAAGDDERATRTSIVFSVYLDGRIVQNHSAPDTSAAG